jgi:dipeptide/tripeptide permease
VASKLHLRGTFWSLAIDVGGPRVGATCGILNFGGNLGGFVAPILTPYIASRAGWSWGLYTGSLIVMTGVFACYLIDPGRVATSRPLESPKMGRIGKKQMWIVTVDVGIALTELRY